MEESIGGQQGHFYTAEEVRLRLERAKTDGELIRDSKGVYRVVGHSGHSGFSGASGYAGSIGRYADCDVPFEKRVEQWKGQHSLIKPRRFSVRAFVRTGIKDLKVFFQTKKEIKHAE